MPVSLRLSQGVSGSAASRFPAPQHPQAQMRSQTALQAHTSQRLRPPVPVTGRLPVVAQNDHYLSHSLYMPL